MEFPSAGTIRLVLTKIDAAALDRITCDWIFAQARKHRESDSEMEWVIAVDGNLRRREGLVGHFATLSLAAVFSVPRRRPASC
jgi:hypothetical protein